MVKPNHVAESRRQDFAVESHSLMRRATWCGLVFALAVLITVLNVTPPVDVTYKVVSQAVISESRLQQLQHGSTAPTQQTSRKAGDSQEAKTAGSIAKVKVLDRAQGDGPSELNTPIGKHLVLVEVQSTWQERCDESTYSVWFEEISRSKSAKDGSSEVGKQLRQARWELSAVEHYAAQQQFRSQSAAAASSNDGRTFQLASTTREAAVDDAKPAATLSNFRTSDSAPSSTIDSALIAQVSAARQKVSEFELAWQRQIQQSSGDVRLAGAIHLVATPSNIPGWLAASVLVLGLAAGASAGWLQYRMQSGGVHDPEMVARQLEHVGLPANGKLEIADVRGGNEDWMERASASVNTTSRRLARNMTIVSEACVGFWLVVIVARLVSDPLWRTVLLESPLAAFGRLIVGMP